jgi:cell division septal protein FtsQ
VKWLYRAVIPVLVVIAIVFVAQKILGGNAVAPRLVSSQPVAVIGSGEDAVAVAADGTVLTWLPLPEDSDLPQLSLASPPKGPRVQGPVLEQVRVLAAAPTALRPYIESSYFGESGVDVELTAGIELRFGNATGAARKWRAAAAVLADPTITTLDYIDLHAPGRPAIHGSGHTLPPLE